MFKFFKERKMAWNFNKEILVGEIGAIAGAQIMSHLFSKFNSSPKIISLSAVLGALIFASFLFLGTRIYDQRNHNIFSLKKTAKDIGYYTPFALLLTLIVYYPVLFFMSKHLLRLNLNLFPAVFFSQLIAFTLFLTFINTYRLSLRKFFGITL